MHVAILTGDIGWHVRDVQRAAAELGHQTSLFDFRVLSERVGIPPACFADCDAILVRTMPAGSLEQIVFRMDVLHRLQAAGKRVVNSPTALEACVDKYLASARLEAAGLRVPATVVCQDAETAMAAFAELGGDVVIKPLFGSEGRGMVRVSEPELAWRTFRTIEQTQGVLYLQQFIRHPGWDLRVFVIGGRVAAAMRRHAKDGWRTNIPQGGRAEAISLTAEEGQLAIAAAEAVGAEVAGVDLLPGAGGELFVLEVNGVPGWRALAEVTGLDVSLQIIKFCEEGVVLRCQ